MYKLKLIISVLLLSITIAMSGKPKHVVLKVEPGNVESLLITIAKANELNADSASKRLFIFIPNGFYDLGERTLTPISGHHISLIGQSMEHTIIRNQPPVSEEGISKTAVFLNRGMGTYLQNLTLQDDLDYYHSGPAGRAVCLQDKGSFTICKNVRMLSYQDTYYGHRENGQYYFEDCKIHGTIDFICGTGDGFFERCTIVVENRDTLGQGECVIVAPRTSETPYGYVFNNCTIETKQSAYHLARGWHTNPRNTWLYTTLVNPQKLLPTRFDSHGMRTVQNDFHEYYTMDLSGRNITPASNRVTFTLNNDSNTVETILAPQQVKRYQIANVFPKWRPDRQTRKIARKAAKLSKNLW